MVAMRSSSTSVKPNFFPVWLNFLARKSAFFMRGTARQNESSAVGGRRIFADVQAFGQRKFSVAEERRGGKTAYSRAVCLAYAGTFNRAAKSD